MRGAHKMRADSIVFKNFCREHIPIERVPSIYTIIYTSFNKTGNVVRIRDTSADVNFIENFVHLTVVQYTSLHSPIYY